MVEYKYYAKRRILMRRFLFLISTAAGEFWRRADLLLLGLCTIAASFSVIIVSSTTASRGAGRFVMIQGAALIIGILLYILFTFLDIDVIAERREILLIFSLLFIATLRIWGSSGGTANRSWLSFSWMPFSIQPAEICKITYIIILAKTMAIYRNKISSFLTIMQIAVITGLMVVLILAVSGDTGVALPYIFIFVIMAYAGGVNIGWFALAAGGTAAVFPFIWNSDFVREDQKNRILMLFDPTIDPEGNGVRYDTIRSLISLQGGGMTGQGLYHGAQTQAGGISAQHTDFVFSSIGEELGLLGCLAVLLLLLFIILRCIYVGVKSGNYMNRLICIGIAGMLTFQVAVNVGMCIGVLPVIGLTLPFISYGGSSIVTMFAAMGIVSGIRMRPAPDSSARYIRPNLGLI